MESLKKHLSELTQTHHDTITELQSQKEQLSYKIDSLDAKLLIESDRRKNVEATVKVVTESKEKYASELRDLERNVESHALSIAKNKLDSVVETTDVLNEATRGIEHVLRKEREERVRERRGAEVEAANDKQSALMRQREVLKKQFAVEKAVAIAEANEAASAELHAMKIKIDDKWKKKFDALKSSSTAAQVQTAKDVKQLTVLHATHVAALERALKEEVDRLNVVREQNKQLTIGRAADAAKNASEREKESKTLSENLKDLEKMRNTLKIAVAEKEEMAKQCSSAKSEASRLSDDKRMSDARIQGVKARLAEAEAECVALTRELQEIRVESRGGTDLVDLIRKENAILRRKGEGAEMQLKRMKDCLLTVNQHIYGAKAAEMCRRVAEGEMIKGRAAGGGYAKDGYGDTPLINLTNKADHGRQKSAAASSSRRAAPGGSKPKPFH
jgi:hypothetical protein